MGDNEGSIPTMRAQLIEQLKVSGGGIAAATVGVPFVIREWTPTSFVVFWTFAYLAQSVFFIMLTAAVSPEAGRRTWSVTTAVLFASICGSVLIWGRDIPASPWIAGMVAFAYISFETATLQYSEMPQWYLGSAIVGTATTVMTFVAIHPVAAIAIAPVIVGVALTAKSNQDLREDLRGRLGAAEMRLNTDPLTGLLNRRGLGLELGRLEGEVATIATFDADRFKLINDTQGHGVGDQALRLIADHLSAIFAADWAIARHGGDEFIAVTAGHAQLPDGSVPRFNMPLHDRAGEVSFTMSAGVASGILRGTGDHLLSAAGHALRHAKREGLHIVRSEGELRQRFERSVAVTSISDADDRIVPVAQPIVSDNGIAGCELLARWRTDDGTLLAPGQFMDMLVENGLLGRLDDVMLGHAVRLARTFEQQGANVFVSANVAASHLLNPGLTGYIRDLLDEHHVSPGRLVIEITESERLGADQRWEVAINELRVLGIKLAIDDFGAGYSSVARLKRLPITHLKLDRSLVTRASGPMGHIVQGVVNFCHESAIDVVAEGIETAEDHIAMRDFGVGLFQGYLFGRPMRIEDFQRDVANRCDPKPLNTNVETATAHST